MAGTLNEREFPVLILGNEIIDRSRLCNLRKRAQLLGNGKRLLMRGSQNFRRILGPGSAAGKSRLRANSCFADGAG